MTAPPGAPLEPLPDALYEPSPPADGPPRVWPVFVILPLAFMAVLAASAMALTIAGVFLAFERSPIALQERLDTFSHSAPGVLSLVLASALAMASAAMLAALLSPERFVTRLRLTPMRIGAFDVLLGAVGLAGLSSSIGALYELLRPLLDTLFQSAGLSNKGTIDLMNKAFAGMSPAMTAAAVFCVGVMPGLGEELLFRGFVQTRLEQRWRPQIAIPITAIAFGVYHLDILQGLFAAFAGLWLGFVASRARSIVPTMIAHASSNAIAVVGAAVGVSAEVVSPHEAAVHAVATGAVAAAAITGFVWRTRDLSR